MKINCPDCKKPTWKGCGQHIAAALKDVPEAERCALWATKSGCGAAATSPCEASAPAPAPAAQKQ
jgi:hypothetical protein